MMFKDKSEPPEVYKRWKEELVPLGFSNVRKMSAVRMSRIADVSKKFDNAEWEEIFGKLKSEKMLWLATAVSPVGTIWFTFDFFIKEETLIKILENAYNAKPVINRNENVYHDDETQDSTYTTINI
jgi:hypothetical protein